LANWQRFITVTQLAVLFREVGLRADLSKPGSIADTARSGNASPRAPDKVGFAFNQIKRAIGFMFVVLKEILQVCQIHVNYYCSMIGV
jgi:hypothetical protein